MSAYRKGLREQAAKRLALAQRFYDRAESRIVMGLPTYGEFDPLTDKRNMGTEGGEEVLDSGNYLKFSEQMRPDLSLFLQKMRAKTIVLYGMWEQLEEMMRTPKREGDA